MIRNKVQKKFIFWMIGVLILFYVVVELLVNKPRNNRNWEVGFEILPHIEINNTKIIIKNVRDYKYAPGKFISSNYLNREVDINKLERAWFVVEPFDGIPLLKFDGIAHTYFVFDFKDEKPIVISVEARREKNEQFGLISGMLNHFELMYVWGTEEDLTIRRVLIENNKLYMYPLTIPRDSAQRLFLQLARTTQKLETEPRFYNSLFSNCTNELAKNANMSKPMAIPYNFVWIFPGYAVNELYNLKLIPTDTSLNEISKKYYISDMVKKYYNKQDFSERLRQNLLMLRKEE